MTRTLHHQYYIGAPRTKVFKAITDPKWLVRWLADSAEIDPSRGGRYLLGWNGGPQHTGTVLEFVPGRQMTLAWEWPEVTLRGTRFKLAVKTRGKGTLLEVEHSGFPREEKWADLYGGAEWGWTYFAMNLKSLLETGRDLRSPVDG